jgi:hypothetical protein
MTLNSLKEKHAERITEWVTGGAYAVAVEVEATFYPDRPGEPYLNPGTVRYLEKLEKFAEAGDRDVLKKAGTVYIRLREAVMDPLDEIDWEILNATADDWEDLEQIFLAVCFEVITSGEEGTPGTGCYYRRVRRAVLLPEIADRIRSLVDCDLLSAVDEENGRPVTNKDDLSYVWHAWFRMTPQGRDLWASSEHANLVEQEQLP